jgi:hypothetical protein
MLYYEGGIYIWKLKLFKEDANGWDMVPHGRYEK